MPVYLKPFQTGCQSPFDKDGDALFISRHAGGRFTVSPEKSTLLCFRQPKAPWFAARNQDREVDLSVVFDTLETLKKNREPVIVEAAGGLMVPVDENTLIIDLVQGLHVRPLLVARAGMGTINHTLLSLEMLKARGIRPLGVVLSDPGPDRTGADMVQENIEAIERFSGVRVGGVIPPVKPFSLPDATCLKPLENLILGEENK